MNLIILNASNRYNFFIETHNISNLRLSCKSDFLHKLWKILNLRHFHVDLHVNLQLGDIHSLIIAIDDLCHESFSTENGDEQFELQGLERKIYE